MEENSIEIKNNESIDSINHEQEETFSVSNTHKKNYDWFIEVTKSSGEKDYLLDKKKYVSILQTNILNEVYGKDNAVVIYSKGEKEEWKTTNYTIRTFVKDHSTLNMLYAPVWEHTKIGMKWGVIGGMVAKLIDTIVGVALVDPTIAVLLIIAIVVCFIPRIGMMGTMIIAFIMMKFTKANVFLIIIVSAFTGAILGFLPGMAVGGSIGLIRKSKLKLAPRIKPEPNHYIFTLALLPLVFGAGIIIFYLFVFNPWLIKIIN